MAKIHIEGDDYTDVQIEMPDSMHSQYPQSLMRLVGSPTHAKDVTWVFNCPDCLNEIEYIGDNKPVKCPRCGVEWKSEIQSALEDWSRKFFKDSALLPFERRVPESEVDAAKDRSEYFRYSAIAGWACWTVTVMAWIISTLIELWIWSR